MTKEITEKKEVKKEVKKEPKKATEKLRPFFFPSLEKSVKATSLKEAFKLLNK